MVRDSRDRKHARPGEPGTVLAFRRWRGSLFGVGEARFSTFRARDPRLSTRENREN